MGAMVTLPDVAYVIVQPCVGVKDASCVEVCPVDCIHTDDAATMYYIDPDECIDCGACVDPCPVDAIFPEDEVPEQWREYIHNRRAEPDEQLPIIGLLGIDGAQPRKPRQCSQSVAHDPDRACGRTIRTKVRSRRMPGALACTLQPAACLGVPAGFARRWKIL